MPHTHSGKDPLLSNDHRNEVVPFSHNVQSLGEFLLIPQDRAEYRKPHLDWQEHYAWF
jgi:hypothetical protein